MKVILHNCTEMFIAASKKPKRFACINQYRFSSFEVVSIEGDGSWPRSELQRVKHSWLLRRCFETRRNRNKISCHLDNTCVYKIKLFNLVSGQKTRTENTWLMYWRSWLLGWSVILELPNLLIINSNRIKNDKSFNRPVSRLLSRANLDMIIEVMV